MSGARQRWVAAATALGVLLLVGCGGSDGEKAAPPPPADRTQRSEAGARATLREYLEAFASTDAKRICDLLDPTSPQLKSVPRRHCLRAVARLKKVLTPAGAARYRKQFGPLEPVVAGNVATLPGRTEPTLRYVEGRWYVIPVRAAGSPPA